ncbi:hypothetical protein B0T09DRAFT_22138 [Sordaria sp. MPI-SDFR-AT-0083]|nr:hypothetical protein B0T09DRAFT_22138 [Sordaria sp. MPI-SDFR-AT-0083]
MNCSHYLMGESPHNISVSVHMPPFTFITSFYDPPLSSVSVSNNSTDTVTPVTRAKAMTRTALPDGCREQAPMVQAFFEALGETLENFGKTIFGEYTPNNATIPHWEPEPTRRGTFGILSACIITLGLCVWTAIHLNVPRHDEGPLNGPLKVTIRKVGWIIMGLLSPELVSCQPFMLSLKSCE